MWEIFIGKFFFNKCWHFRTYLKKCLLLRWMGPFSIEILFVSIGMAPTVKISYKTLLRLFWRVVCVSLCVCVHVWDSCRFGANRGWCTIDQTTEWFPEVSPFQLVVPVQASASLTQLTIISGLTSVSVLTSWTLQGVPALSQGSAVLWHMINHASSLSLEQSRTCRQNLIIRWQNCHF